MTFGKDTHKAPSNIVLDGSQFPMERDIWGFILPVGIFIAGCGQNNLVTDDFGSLFSLHQYCRQHLLYACIEHI